MEAQPPIPLVFQLLVVPVTDNTASESDRWAENKHTPWLTPARMMWFRNNYLPNKEDWTKWDASPIFAPRELVSKVPRAWIGVAELDILRDEGVAYGEMLKREGVQVETVVYPKAPHPIMAMDSEIVYPLHSQVASTHFSSLNACRVSIHILLLADQAN